MLKSDINRQLKRIRKELFPRRRVRSFFANIFAVYIYLSLLVTTGTIVLIAIFGGEVNVTIYWDSYDHIQPIINHIKNLWKL